MNPNKIKPCLLFEDADEGLEAVEEEPEDDEVDEEAETDIDEASQGSQSSAIIVTSSKKSQGKKPARAITPESEDEIQHKMSSFKARLAASGSASSRKKVPSSRALFDESEDDDPFGAPTPSGKSKSKPKILGNHDGFSSDEEESGVPYRQRSGVKRALGSILDTPQSAPRKKTRRALF